MRKVRRPRKNKVVKDPEEIKEVKLERLYVKRVHCGLMKEVHWDNRFVLDTIPDLFAHKRNRGLTQPKGERSPVGGDTPCTPPTCRKTVLACSPNCRNSGCMRQ